jgi:beta-lactamase superfamily II metal-dependent hydrolase
MKKLLIILLISGICFGYAFRYQKFLGGTGELLQVSFLDVGQGDAIYIRAPNGNDILIDGGPDDSVIQKLHEVMPSFDKDIDLMIATHPDKDHIAGLSTVLEQYQVRYFLHSEISSGTSFDKSLQALAATEPGLLQVTARRGERFIIDHHRGIYIDILFPDQNTSHFKETNDASIVARLVYKKQSFLFTGDSPVSVEQFLAQTDKSTIQSNVLKLGHHGSNSATSETYLNVVKPQYAIVSAGKNNTYHHPHPTIVARILARHITLLSTIDLGTITFKTDGISLQTK